MNTLLVIHIVFGIFLMLAGVGAVGALFFARRNTQSGFVKLLPILFACVVGSGVALVISNPAYSFASLVNHTLLYAGVILCVEVALLSRLRFPVALSHFAFVSICILTSIPIAGYMTSF